MEFIINLGAHFPLNLFVFDDYNRPVQLDLSLTSEEALRDTESAIKEDVTFYLYTNLNPILPQLLFVNDTWTFEFSLFNMQNPTVFVAHGWSNSHLNPACTQVKDAYLKHGEYNVILVDWSPITKNSYPFACNRVVMVGKHVSSMIDFIEDQGVDVSKMTTVGHSLGAHVAGLAAYYARSKVDYVVGLDPALPGFENVGPGSRISKKDGKYVMIIHTAGATLGMVAPIGHVDFYPNGGYTQPGCTVDFIDACSHYRAPKYFAESINSKVGFLGQKCSSYKNFKNRKCKSKPVAYMGTAEPNFKIRGVYYLKTASESPFALPFSRIPVPDVSQEAIDPLLKVAIYTIARADQRLLMLDDNQNLVPLDLSLKYPETVEETQRELPNHVIFNLYTRVTPETPQILRVNDTISLKNSCFSPKRPTIIATHGWINSHNNPSCTEIRDAYLKHGDYNVILVDWSYISMKPYAWARSRVPMVSKYVSAFINFLVEHGLDVSKLTVAGHSLGGQVAGLASHYAKHKAKLVISLDPALPLFEKSGPGERVSRGDAEYVMVIHTAAGLYGYDVPLGDIDFYPNGGTDQLGCTAATLGFCSHFRAPYYFAESINSERGFWGVKCDNYEDYRAGKCKSNPVALMGGVKPNFEARGTYYLDTAPAPPFALGPVS
ncbi:uncharacterized protein LOC128893753 [Hylaeus anthracinus]|uniref:uncharacterized protein LOC128893753 n=1 Tax=Hylaeus anthracinus TaxID=313031 RepID=UPI0023B92843|nr:uncharacterized protein LOC128893753 [Hylaeus anthracinus]